MRMTEWLKRNFHRPDKSRLADINRFGKCSAKNFSFFLGGYLTPKTAKKQANADYDESVMSAAI